jgi:serine/threonine-protein kinase
VKVGRVVAGRWRLVRPLGRGGTSAVYEAHAVDGSGARVAVKIVDAAWARDEVVMTRLAREAKAASAAASDHVVRVLDGGVDAGDAYLVLEYLDGEDLGAKLAREGRLAVDEARRIAIEVLAGLVAAHAAGVVHRDLKPDNVMLARDAMGRTRAVVGDFGTAKIEPKGAASTVLVPITRAGVALGTPLYMSPEHVQARGDIDARADVFSVGAILFECLCGRPPFVGKSYEQVMLKICLEDAPDVRTWAPDVPAEMAAVVARALRRERAERFGSADEMRKALTGTWASTSTSTSTGTGTSLAWFAVAAFLAGVAVVALVVAALRMR